MSRRLSWGISFEKTNTWQLSEPCHQTKNPVVLILDISRNFDSFLKKTFCRAAINLYFLWSARHRSANSTCKLLAKSIICNKKLTFNLTLVLILFPLDIFWPLEGKSTEMPLWEQPGMKVEMAVAIPESKKLRSPEEEVAIWDQIGDFWSANVSQPLANFIMMAQMMKNDILSF